MREHPILFNGAMVRAVLDGKKTQTRRIVKPQPSNGVGRIMCDAFEPIVIDRHGEEQPGAEIYGAYDDDGTWGAKCPFGAPGDRLWVRETWAQDSEDGQLCYRADIGAGSDADDWERNRVEGAPGYRWRPSIHMPRRASRIILEVTSVRVERLHDISEKDATTEGCFAGNWEYDNGEGTESAKETFMCLWDSIYQNWDENPWVWVVEFKRA